MNTDKAFYDQEILEGIEEEYVATARPYLENWLGEARQMFAGRRDVRALDLGAGSCTSSLLLSNEDFIGSVVAADISAERMRAMVERTRRITGGDLSKLDFAEIDFNDPLPFPDDRFDLVMMDAALHHSRNIWHTLTEVRRVLVPGGIFVAQREAYTSPLTNGITFRRLLSSPEVAAGVSENAYLKSQYDYYLRVNGFEPRFVPVYENVKFKLLFFANGWLFSKYNIIAKSTKGQAGQQAAA